MKSSVALLVVGLVMGVVVGGVFTFAVVGSPVPVTVTVSEFLTETFSTVVTETREAVETITVRDTVTRTVTATLEERSRIPPVLIEVKYARLFGIKMLEGYKIVTDALNRTLILVERGQAPPLDVEGIVIEIPVDRVVLLSATHVALLHRLMEYNPGILDTIAGITWGRSYEWYFEDIGKALEEGRIKDLGASWSPNYEEILAINPDLMLIYTFPGDQLPGKLEELGIKYAVDNEWLETNALGRFEWIKFIATFYDMDYEAYLIFNEVENKVEDIIRKVSGEPSPKIAWFSIYKGTVYAAGGGSYVATALKELGADYIFKDTAAVGGISVTIEELIARTLDADVIVYTSEAASVEDILKEAPALADSKAVREGRVYAIAPNYHQLGYAYTEDWYLDLAAILYPSLFPDHELRFFEKLPTGEVG